MSFSESLYQMIQQPRQTYFCLQVNKQIVEMTYWGHFSTKYHDVKHFVFHYIHNFEYKKGLSFFTKQQKYFYFSINLMYNIDVRNNNYYS